MGPNHPKERRSFVPRRGPSKGLRDRIAGIRLSRSTATAKRSPPHPSSTHLSHGSAMPSSTKMGRSKKRDMASWMSSWRSLASLRSEEHTSELQSRQYLVCRLLLEKKHTLPLIAVLSLVSQYLLLLS